MERAKREERERERKKDVLYSAENSSKGGESVIAERTRVLK